MKFMKMFHLNFSIKSIVKFWFIILTYDNVMLILSLDLKHFYRKYQKGITLPLQYRQHKYFFKIQTCDNKCCYSMPCLDSAQLLGGSHSFYKGDAAIFSVRLPIFLERRRDCRVSCQKIQKPGLEVHTLLLSYTMLQF